jgi:predicted nucleotide-binding protein (sugar kinase/HSP70/actin superfamily)
VVAYYPEVLKHNIAELADKSISFISDYVSLADPVFLPKRLHQILGKRYQLSKSEIRSACNAGFESLASYRQAIRKQGQLIIEHARSKGWPIMVLCGRPYHTEAEVNHGIDQLLLQCGCAVISEDTLSHLVEKEKRTVLNQWTYHARMYDAARYVASQKDMHLIQLVSFGCGLDAVTTDEVRDILRKTEKIYTQIKIDEIVNLGAVKIRIRSLLAAISQESK